MSSQVRVSGVHWSQYDPKNPLLLSFRVSNLPDGDFWMFCKNREFAYWDIKLVCNHTITNGANNITIFRNSSQSILRRTDRLAVWFVPNKTVTQDVDLRPSSASLVEVEGAVFFDTWERYPQSQNWDPLVFSYRNDVGGPEGNWLGFPTVFNTPHRINLSYSLYERRQVGTEVRARGPVSPHGGTYILCMEVNMDRMPASHYIRAQLFNMVDRNTNRGLWVENDDGRKRAYFDNEPTIDSNLTRITLILAHGIPTGFYGALFEGTLPNPSPMDLRANFGGRLLKEVIRTGYYWKYPNYLDLRIFSTGGASRNPSFSSTITYASYRPYFFSGIFTSSPTTSGPSAAPTTARPTRHPTANPSWGPPKISIGGQQINDPETLRLINLNIAALASVALLVLVLCCLGLFCVYRRCKRQEKKEDLGVLTAEQAREQIWMSTQFASPLIPEPEEIEVEVSYQPEEPTQVEVKDDDEVFDTLHLMDRASASASGKFKFGLASLPSSAPTTPKLSLTGIPSFISSLRGGLASNFTSAQQSYNNSPLHTPRTQALLTPAPVSMDTEESQDVDFTFPRVARQLTPTDDHRDSNPRVDSFRIMLTEMDSNPQTIRAPKPILGTDLNAISESREESPQPPIRQPARILRPSRNAAPLNIPRSTGTKISRVPQHELAEIGELEEISLGDMMNVLDDDESSVSGWAE